MNLKPLYKADNTILVGLKADFIELCVLDGLVVEVDLDGRKILSEPESGLRKLKSGGYLPIRPKEKKDFTRLIERRLRKKLIRKIEESLEDPSRESVESLVWVPDRLGGNGAGN